MRVLVTEPSIWECLRADAAVLAEFEFVYAAGSDHDLILRELPGADAYVGIVFTAEMAAVASRRIRLVQITAAGTDHVELAGLPAGVPVCNSFGHGRAIAEYVVMASIAARRGLVWRDRQLRSGVWESRLTDPHSPRFRNLGGTTMGILGFGHIGQAIAGLARAVGLRTLAIRQSGTGAVPAVPGPGEPTWVGGPEALDAVCELSDTLVLAAPLTERTRGIVGAARLALLGPDGCLVNVGRAALVDEEALYRALHGGTLGCAALDVWYRTPPDGRGRPSSWPFHELRNVVMTPHYSATSDDTYVDRTAEIVANLRRVRSGETPHNVVTETDGIADR